MQSTNRYGVAKFGGTSVATYEAMLRCAKVISNYPSVRVVVVSAPAGVTNLLVKLTQSHLSQVDIDTTLAEIYSIIQNILTKISDDFVFQLKQQVSEMLLELNMLVKNREMNNAIKDEVLSFGERLSARLFTCILKEQAYTADYVDARSLIKTNDSFSKAEVLVDITKENVEKILLPKCANQILVTEGFIGSTLQNSTTTLGRGGSDYSAAILAEAIEAEVLQIWTDVAGIYSADPRLVPNAKPIERISFSAAAELATFGAKVLHPATLWPAIRKDIPVFIGSSMCPEDTGTWIRSQDRLNDLPQLHAISLRRKQSLLTIHSLEMLHAHGFLAKIFSILARHQLSVDLVTTSEVSVALTLNHSDGGTSSDAFTSQVLDELNEIANISLTIDHNLCLIALVGNHLHRTPGISGRIFNVLSAYNVRLICHGASQHNICFLVDESDAENIAKIMHAELFENIKLHQP